MPTIINVKFMVNLPEAEAFLRINRMFSTIFLPKEVQTMLIEYPTKE